MATVSSSPLAICLALTRAISGSRTVDEICVVALDALESGLQVTRSSILLFDSHGVMRFKAHRRLSARYRAAVEGHTPWTAETRDPQPIVVAAAAAEPSLAPFLEAIEAEGIRAMAFVPLVSEGRVIGECTLYSDGARSFSADELQLAAVIASQVAFALARMRADDRVRQSKERLRFAMEAATMVAWEWDLETDRITWSDDSAVHALTAGPAETFADYVRQIHPDDRATVLSSVNRAVVERAPHDVEFRLVGADGAVHWVEGKGRVEPGDGPARRMSGVSMMATRRKEAELAHIASLEESNRLRDEFLATLSHELRTPLHAILGWVQVLEHAGPDNGRLTQALDVIGRNARLQAQLIEDILDVSRIVSGKLEIERLPVAVPALIHAVVSGIQPAAAERRLTFAVADTPDTPPVTGDRQRLHQILGNILANAVKFTPDGGTISIRSVVDGGEVLITVQDSGIGMDPEFLTHAFDRFRQGDSRPTRHHGGLGLGLAIARHLVELHGGTIAAASEGEGRGTTISVRLPIHQPRRPGSRDTAVAGTIPQLTGTAVLVVDDQADSRELLQIVLSAYGARVSQADSAGAALSLLQAEPFQLLVADIAMPGVDGYELIRRVRKGHPTLPAVAVTAYARPEDRRRALHAGYNASCAKPIEVSRFLQTLGEVLPH